LAAGGQDEPMVDYGPVPDENVGDYREVVDHASRAEAGPAPVPSDEATDGAALGERRALYDGQRPVTTAPHYPFTVMIRGEWVPAVGLGSMATRPEARHQGHVRTMLRKSLAEYRERGWPVAHLWPFRHESYRQPGWGRLGLVCRYEFDPRAVATTRDYPLAGGRFRRLEPADYDALQQLNERVAESTDLTMCRTEGWYRHRFFGTHDGEPFIYGWFDDDQFGGDLRYRVEQSEDDRELQISDFGAQDPAAMDNLLRFIHRHAAQTEAVRLHAPPNELFLDLVADPPAAEMAVRPGPMGQLIDVGSALGTLPVPTDLTVSFRLRVSDCHGDWSDGLFELTVGDGAIDVQAESEGEPLVELPVETHSRLVFGSITAERAAVAGGLKADDGTVSLLGELFPPRETYLR
jgi:predicted acetyltransferase